MVEINQFGSSQAGDPQTCSRCEALLMDVLDGAASAEDQHFFDQHGGSCTACSQMLADARRGGAWLEMLRDPRPEPPAALYERILARTSGLTAVNRAMASQDGTALAEFGARVAVPGRQPAFAAGAAPSAYAFAVSSASSRGGPMKILPFRIREMAHHLGQTMLQPRLAMTAAMAFFSIALTLNLTGVHVSELRMSDLRPTNLRRGFYEANAHIVRYCDNLRVVYELEARAHDLQRNSDGDTRGNAPATQDDGQSDAPKKPANDPDGSAPPKVAPKPGPGTSRRDPMTRDGLSVASLEARNAPSSSPKMDLKGDPA